MTSSLQPLDLEDQRQANNIGRMTEFLGENMKTKSIIVALLLALVLALSAFAACDKQGAEHKSDGVYQSDDAYHWHGCTACDEHIYDKAPHEFVADGAQKSATYAEKTYKTSKTATK